MAKPTKYPRWANVGGSIVEPTEAKKDTGWFTQEKPPAQFFNWLLNLIYQWVLYLEVVADLYFNITKGFGPITPGGSTQSRGFSAVTHIGIGVGTVLPKLTATLTTQRSNGGNDFVVKITTSGAIGAAQFQLSGDGGATYGAVTNTIATYTDVTLGIVLAFAGASFTIGDTYSFSSADTDLAAFNTKSGRVGEVIDHLGMNVRRYRHFSEEFEIPFTTLTGVYGPIPLVGYPRWQTTSPGTYSFAWAPPRALPGAGGTRWVRGIEIYAPGLGVTPGVRLNSFMKYMFTTETVLCAELEFVDLGNGGTLAIGFSDEPTGILIAPPVSSINAVWMQYQSASGVTAFSRGSSVNSPAFTSLSPPGFAINTFRVELHGTLTPTGGAARFFVNGLLVAEIFTNLPAAASILAVCIQHFSGSTSVGSPMIWSRLTVNAVGSLLPLGI